MVDWDKINAVEAMQDYIVTHYSEDITLQDITKSSGFSMWYAVRLFKQLTGKTPFEYLRALRLTEAAKKLRDFDKKVLDVALEAGFDSHDGFTRAFTQRFKIAPNQYKKTTPPVGYFVHYPVRNYYSVKAKGSVGAMEKDKLSGVITVSVVEKPQRILVFLPAKKAEDYFSYCEENGCDWEGFLNSIEEKLEPAAIIVLPSNMVPAGMAPCAAGVEVPQGYAKPLPEEYHSIELPPCKMLYFEGEPYKNEEDFCEAIDYVTKAVESYRPERYGYKIAKEIAPSFNFGASAKEGAKMAIPIIEV